MNESGHKKVNKVNKFISDRFNSLKFCNPMLLIHTSKKISIFKILREDLLLINLEEEANSGHQIGEGTPIIEND